MRLLHYLKLLVLATLIFGCQKKEASETTIAFEVVDNWNITADVTAWPGEPLTRFLPTSRIYSACADSCRRNKISLQEMQQVALREATITLQAPPGQNFDFVRQITVHITSEQGNDRVVLATLPDIPLGATRLTLTPTTTSLLHYLRPGFYYLTPQLELRQPGNTVAQLRIQMRYQVQARR